MRILSAFVGICILSAALAQGQVRDVYLCEFLFENFCTGAASCPSDPMITFGSSSYHFENFNLVSFDSFFANSGDVEGRAIIRNNLNLPLGQYSFGYELRTGGASAADNSLPYALVVGRDAVFNGGAILPDGSNFPFQGAKEDMYVGGTFSGPGYLAARRTGGPCATAGCKDADFDNAQAFYTELSKEIDALTDNAVMTVQYGNAHVACASSSSATYYVHTTPALFSTITSWSQSGCNTQSAIAITIKGAGQVKFAGNTQAIWKNERTVYNVAGNNAVRVEVGIRGNLLAPQSQYNQPGMGVFIGQVIVANVVEALQINRIYCAPQAPPIHPPITIKLCPSWETACAGMDVDLAGQTYSFRDFNAIVFGNFNADTGDIQGRLAVRDNAKMGCGYSVGDQLQTAANKPDNSLPYSLLVGRDLSWCSGALYPNGDGNPYPAAREDMYVGGNFATNQSDLNPRRTGGPCVTPGCYDQEFADAKLCYDSYSSAIAAKPDNVQKTIQWSGLAITCNDASANDYYVSLEPSDFAQFTYTTVGNCNFQGRWHINVRGNGDVTITGDSFPGVPGGTVYNVIGTRNVHIFNHDLAGALLAPDATVTQEGVINGKVVALNVAMSRQINKQNACPNPVEITIPVVVKKPAVQVNLIEFSNNALRVGDNLGKGIMVTEYKGDNVYAVNKPASFNEGQVVYVKVKSDQGRAPDAVAEPKPANGASSVTIAFAVIAALVALAF